MELNIDLHLYIIYMIGHECIFRMRGGLAGRQIDRVGTKYRLTSMYIIDDKACMYN